MTRVTPRHVGRGSGTGASAGATDPLADHPAGVNESVTDPPPVARSGAAPAVGSAAPTDRLAEQLLMVLCDARHQSLFVTELAAVACALGAGADRLEQLLAEWERAGRVTVLGRPPPDVHLAGTDLRTVHHRDDPSPAAAASAHRRAEEHWADFVRTFLAARRCC